MKLATARIGGTESAALVVTGGVVPVREIRDLGGWPADLLSLLVGGHLEDFRGWWDGLSERDLEELSEQAMPPSDISYAPLYRRPRKIWGIGLNY